jgi:mRNA interferase RelE/StbE
VKVQVDRDVLVWLHKQPRNVFLTVLSAILGLVSDPAPQNSTEMRDGSDADCASVTTGSSTASTAMS